MSHPLSPELRLLSLFLCPLTPLASTPETGLPPRAMGLNHKGPSPLCLVPPADPPGPIHTELLLSRPHWP